MEVGRIDAGRLVFVDEMGTHTSLAPLYVYAPIGERAFFEVPRNRGKNTTLLTSLHQEGMGPSMAVERGYHFPSVRDVRDLRGALAGSRPAPWSGCSDGHPRGTPAQEGKGVDRGEGLQAHLPAFLLA